MTTPAAPLDLRRDLVALLPRLRRFALTLSRSTGEADERVRSACLEAVGKGRCEEAEGRLDVWLFRLLCDQPQMAGDSRPATVTDIGAIASVSNACATAQQRLAMDMPEDLAGVFVLVESEGFSCDEAAGILGLPVDDVASRLCRARLYFADMHPPLLERRA